MKKKILSAVLSVAMLGSLFGAFAMPASADAVKAPAYQTQARNMEKINRGLIAVKTTANSANGIKGGVYLSWRLLGTESLENQAFDIYKNTDTNKIYTTGVHDATNWTDTSGAATDNYKVVPAGSASNLVAAETWVTPTSTVRTARGSLVGNGSEKNAFTYMDVPIQRPADVKRMGDGKLSHYYSDDYGHEGGANDASIGDLDGDGDYELVLKWDPQDSKDSAGADYTGNVYIDAYEITTDKNNLMWRIDLGPNVTAGAHYTQFIVFDFDGDGRSEVAMKTGPGSKDSAGNYVTDVGDTEEIKNYDNEKSYVGDGSVSGGKGKNIYGKEFLTVFDGETGVALATTEYIPLISSGTWGDSKYNRAERFLAGVAYLDGVHPSIIMCRGYYERAVLRAYDFDGDALTLRWEHIGTTSKTSMFHSGNHQLSIADVDDDGKDEIVYGSAVLDDDGKLYPNSNKGYGHGDALHVNDFNNDGIQEAFSVKEHKEGYKSNAANFRNLKTGDDFWGKGASGDTGRGVMANVDDDYAKSNSNALALGWSSSHANVFDLAGNELKARPATSSRGMTNFLVYWDGDLGRELLDDNQLAKYHADTGYTTRFYDDGNGYISGTSNNFSKHTPSLSADLWGDWREEIIMPIGKKQNETPYLRIFTSILPTDYRLTTLMHDSQYRCAIAWQNVGYNQPPHTSYYIGSAALANDGTKDLNYLAPAMPFTNVTYPESTAIRVSGVSLSEHTLTLERTKTAQLNATITPEDAKRKGITWTSSNEKVATVSNGIVTGVGKGTATITATTRDGGFTDACEVTVWSNDVEGVSVDETLVNIGLGKSASVDAVVTPEDASEKSVIWSSTNPAVASVSETGEVKALSAGVATIYATTVDGGYTAGYAANIVPLTENTTADDVFKTDNTDAESVLSYETATGANFTQTDATVGGSFYRTFEKISEGSTKLSFKFTTGGTKMKPVYESDGVTQKKDENGNLVYDWGWDGHEFSFYVKLLGEDNANILTLSQPFRTKAGTLESKIGANDTTGFTVDWSTVKEGLGTVQGSAKRWLVEIEFDYDNKTANAVLYGFGNGFDNDATAQYETSFELPVDDDGKVVSLNKLEVSSTKDGDENSTIIWRPILQEVSYAKLEPVDGASETLYKRGNKYDKPWSTSDTSDWTVSSGASFTYDSANGRVQVATADTPGSSYSAKKTISGVSDNATLTYDIDWYFGNATYRASNVEYLQIGSNFRLGWVGGGSTGGYFTFVSTEVDSNGKPVYNGITDGTPDSSKSIFSGSNAAYTKNVKLVIDTATKTIESFKFDGKEISAYTGYELPSTATFDTVTVGFDRGGKVSDNKGIIIPVGIDDIMVLQFAEGAKPKFPVTFANYNEEVLQSGSVDVGTKPSYTGATPTRAQDAMYSYSFSGWSPELTAVVDETVYKAQYDTTPREYDVTLNPVGGTIVTNVESYTYGTAVSLPQDATRTGYTFGGWYENANYTGSAVAAIPNTATGNKTYYAKWTTSSPGITITDIGATGVELEFTSTQKPEIIGVLYDGTEVKEVKTADLSSITSFASLAMYTTELGFNNTLNNYTLKIFMWDSLNGVKPILTQPYERDKQTND